MCNRLVLKLNARGTQKIEHCHAPQQAHSQYNGNRAILLAWFFPTHVPVPILSY
jgi:hypothetical protein